MVEVGSFTTFPHPPFTMTCRLWCWSRIQSQESGAVVPQLVWISIPTVCLPLPPYQADSGPTPCFALGWSFNPSFTLDDFACLSWNATWRHLFQRRSFHDLSTHVTSEHLKVENIKSFLFCISNDRTTTTTTTTTTKNNNDNDNKKTKNKHKNHTSDKDKYVSIQTTAVEALLRHQVWGPFNWLHSTLDGRWWCKEICVLDISSRTSVEGWRFLVLACILDQHCHSCSFCWINLRSALFFTALLISQLLLCWLGLKPRSKVVETACSWV